eukprot:TRINITY_DN14650_c0_g1_i1.p1 TRINITY_DN14650_c0_g1~~TRINITY_DN14650_c0_g1_i1.p1  ORF type:complete len:114 (-),score=40.61 TRINITY_DN14650_c0_g1_i1:104-445(-)
MDDDDEGDPEEPEEDEGEEEAQEDHEMADHPSWEACIEKAEAVEKEVGLFDVDKGDTLEKAKQIAAHAESVTGKKSANYVDMLHAHMREKVDTKVSFGAQEVCVHLLKHHDEL